MKKYASLLLFALLLNGCDDGDLTVDTIDFDDTSIVSQSCDPLTNNLIYRLKAQESLLIQLPNDKIINDQTLTNAPLIYNIDNSTYRVVYRAYDGTVSATNICGAIPPTTPKVTEEWQATAGQIVIITTQQTQTADDGSTKITGYNHNISFKNITFLKPAGPQVEQEFSFGDFTTTVTPVVVTFSDETADYCADTKKIYNDNTVSSLVLENLADGLIVNEATPTGSPRTSLVNLNGTTNKLYYRTYSGGLPVDTKSYFCTEKTPTTPAILDTWFGQDGQANVSGIIEVTTTNDLKVFRHKIVLKNATLQKGNSTFKLATTFSLGTVTVVVP